MVTCALLNDDDDDDRIGGVSQKMTQIDVGVGGVWRGLKKYDIIYGSSLNDR